MFCPAHKPCTAQGTGRSSVSLDDESRGSWQDAERVPHRGTVRGADRP